MPTFATLSACTQEGSTSQCAIESKQCPSGFTFELANVALYNHASCKDSIEEIETGRCDDTGRCAYDMNGCKDPSTYQDPKITGKSQDCTIAIDEDSHDFVIHSKCNKKGQELCHVGDCSDGIVTPHVKECHCGSVWTGACVNRGTGKHFCAVDRGACLADPDTEWHTAHELWAEKEIDCRLCSRMYYEHPGVKKISREGAFGLGLGFGAIPVFILAVWYVRCCRRAAKDVEKQTPGEAEMS
jgi:hypothetical protein